MKLNEQQLRILHDLMAEALKDEKLAPHYSAFVRRLRQKNHPVGRTNIIKVKYNEDLSFYIDTGDRLGCDFYYGHYSEQFESQVLLNLMQPHHIFLDVGSNFGYYAICAGHKIDEARGKIFAFEPNEDAYKLLTENIALNRLESKIEAVNCCIGDMDGTTEFFICEESSFSGIYHTGRSKLKKKIDIPVCRIDTLCRKWNINKINLIKIDVEGLEYKILIGAREIIEVSKNIVIMMEISQKNLSDASRYRLVETLNWLYAFGIQAWMADFTDSELVRIEAIDKLVQSENCNIFLAYRKSESESRLIKTYKEFYLASFSTEPNMNSGKEIDSKSFQSNDLNQQMFINTIEKMQEKIEVLKMKSGKGIQ